MQWASPGLMGSDFAIQFQTMWAAPLKFSANLGAREEREDHGKIQKKSWDQWLAKDPHGRSLWRWAPRQVPRAKARKEMQCRWLQSVCRTTDGPQDPRHMPSPQNYSTGFCSQAETKTVLYAPKKRAFCLVHFQSENSQPRAHTSSAWEEKPSPIPNTQAACPQLCPHPDRGVRPLLDGRTGESRKTCQAPLWI